MKLNISESEFENIFNRVYKSSREDLMKSLNDELNSNNNIDKEFIFVAISNSIKMNSIMLYSLLKEIFKFSDNSSKPLL